MEHNLNNNEHINKENSLNIIYDKLFEEDKKEITIENDNTHIIDKYNFRNNNKLIIKNKYGINNYNTSVSIKDKFKVLKNEGKIFKFNYYSAKFFPQNINSLNSNKEILIQIRYIKRNNNNNNNHLANEDQEDSKLYFLFQKVELSSNKRKSTTSLMHCYDLEDAIYKFNDKIKKLESNNFINENKIK